MQKPLTSKERKDYRAEWRTMGSCLGPADSPRWRLSVTWRTAVGSSASSTSA